MRMGAKSGQPNIFGSGLKYCTKKLQDNHEYDRNCVRRRCWETQITNNLCMQVRNVTYSWDGTNRMAADMKNNNE